VDLSPVDFELVVGARERQLLGETITLTAVGSGRSRIR
jgi:hypothetical protein